MLFKLAVLCVVNVFNMMLFVGTVVTRPEIARWSIIWLVYLLSLNTAFWLYYQQRRQRPTGGSRSVLRYLGWSMFIIFPPGLALVAFDSKDVLPLVAIIFAVLIGVSCLYLADRFDAGDTHTLGGPGG